MTAFCGWLCQIMKSLALRITVVLAGLIVGAWHCAGGEASSAPTLEDYLKGLGYQSVALENNRYSQPFVQGVLGNGRKLKFIVDTAWSVTTLKESVAQGLKTVSDLGGIVEDSILGKVTNHDIVMVDKLTIGGVEFLNQPARVRQLRADFTVVPYDGALGFDFLLRNFSLIDSWRHQMYVRTSNPSREQLQALAETLRLSGFTEIPLEPHYLLGVRAEINHQPVLLAIDTGAAFEELDDSEVKPLGLKIIKADRAPTGSLIPGEVTGSVLGLGDTGRHRMHITKVDTLRVGPRQWNNVYFGVTDLKAWGLAKPGTPGQSIKGLLSQGLLSRHGALIDVRNHTLWLRQEKL